MVGGITKLEIVLDEVYNPNREMIPKYIIGCDPYNDASISFGATMLTIYNIETGKIICDCES